MTEQMEDAEVVVGSDIELRPQSPVNLFGSEEPAAIIERATQHAKALADVIKDRKLYSNIQGKNYVRVEGWTLLGSMLGVFPVLEWTRPIEKGWMARVEARTLNGQLVGAAEAQCTKDERNWKSRDDYAIQSMAQTRATAKALRIPLGFVMELAGYNATPAEEIPFESGTEQQAGTTSNSKAGRNAPSQSVAKSSKEEPKASAPSPATEKPASSPVPSEEVEDGSRGSGPTEASSEENVYGLIATAMSDKKLAEKAIAFANTTAVRNRALPEGGVNRDNITDLPEHVLEIVAQKLHLYEEPVSAAS